MFRDHRGETFITSRVTDTLTGAGFRQKPCIKDDERRTRLLFETRDGATVEVTVRVETPNRQEAHR